LSDVVRGRLDASLDWRLVVAAADLPKEISDVIGHVVRRTRLWRSERVDVAEELAAHFQDGLDAGRSPEELVQSFGDPQPAARLIRRAKKRGRSLLWQFLRYACRAVGALLILYFAAGVYLLMGRPTVKTDYLAIINERALAVPERERAWPLYRDALVAMGVKPDESNPADAHATFNAPGDDNWPEEQQFLSDHAGELAKLREASGRQELGFVTATSHVAFSAKDRELFGVEVTSDDIEAFKHQTIEDRWLISTLLPYLHGLRSAASLLASDVRRAALAGDGDTALKDVVALYGISHHCVQPPFLVNLLVAESVQKQARAAIRDVLSEHPGLWTDAQIRELAHRVAAAQIDWRRGIDGERTCFYDSMQRLYTDDGNDDGRLALHVRDDQNLFQLLESMTSSGSRSAKFSNNGLAALLLPAANMVVASRREMTDTFERVTCRALEKIETPLWEDRDSPSLDDEVRALENEPLGKFRYLFVRLLVPAYDSLRNTIAASNGEREGVLIGLALELYHREHGKWPASLAELSPRWLPTVPLDRITGEALHYKIVHDRPVMYSVGVDSDDDGGRTPKYYSERDLPYTVGPAYEAPPNAVQGFMDQYDGDWVIWSTLPKGGDDYR
jgi:hypothetical protein